MKMLEFARSNNRVGLLTRNGTAGPEADLVESFKDYIPRCFRWRKGRVALFREPQLDTGFPDLVVVQYLPQTFRSWPRARLNLKSLDLKILHHLQRVKAADSAALFSALGIDAKGLLAALERLLDANMITRVRRTWRPRPLTQLFGLLSIVAIEAKIKNWGSAFKQGHLNQWFASESYVLSPVESPRSKVLERSQRTGVGIFLLNGGGVRRLKSAQKHRIPISYGSWMFNEWIGRYLNREAERWR